MEITTIGLDLAKQVLQIHGVNEAGDVVVKRRLRRAQVINYFASLPACLIGMEACATAQAADVLDARDLDPVLGQEGLVARQDGVREAPRPVAIPTRAASDAPSFVLNSCTASTSASPARTARSASSSCAFG
jgi:hypothetical protein